MVLWCWAGGCLEEIYGTPLRKVFLGVGTEGSGPEEYTYPELQGSYLN